MKSTIHLERPPTPPQTSARPSTLRLGLVVSIVAALAAVIVRALIDVPTVLILIPVVVVGFALSWHAAGQATGDDQP